MAVDSIREGGAADVRAGMVNVGRVTVGTYEGGVDVTVGVCIAEQGRAGQSRAPMSVHSRALHGAEHTDTQQERASINE